MRKRPLTAKGFTLIELLVVLVLMSLITLAFLDRQQKFDSSTIMRSLAYSIALSVRQAQVYGISVRPTTSGSGVFSSSHGLYFSNSTPNSYVLFADTDNDNKYGGSDPVEDTFTVGNSYSISEFCAVYYSGSTQVRRCDGPDDSGGGNGSISSLDIIFVRPNPDANIYAYDASGNPISGDPPYSYAYIRLKALDGTYRGIHVWATGQISVDQLNDPI